MSKLQQVTGTDAGRQCVDLVRRFPWIDRSAAEPPEGVELLTVKFDDGDASKIECCIFDHDDPASDFKFTHWFPAPRQPECSNWIDDNESPYWPEPGERMGFQLITATLEEARGLLAKADLCECTAALHMLASRKNAKRPQIGKQRLIAWKIRELVKHRDIVHARVRLRREIEAERSAAK